MGVEDEGTGGADNGPGLPALPCLHVMSVERRNMEQSIESHIVSEKLYDSHRNSDRTGCRLGTTGAGAAADAQHRASGTVIKYHNLGGTGECDRVLTDVAFNGWSSRRIVVDRWESETELDATSGIRLDVVR